MHNSSPALFQYWLTNLISEIQGKSNSEFIFINAWNEWGEGCHLEPDQKYKHQFLKAVSDAKTFAPLDQSIKLELEAYYLGRKKRNFIRSLKDKVKATPALYTILRPLYRLVNGFR
jgi:hypothetical protein